jgi:hypothetical protein
MRIVRNLDLIALALALPVFIAAGLPLLGWAAITVSWRAARALQSVALQRALETGTRQAALSARAAALVARLFLVTLSVLGAGLVDSDAGVAAGLLAVGVFTCWFISVFILEAAGEGAR